MSRRPRTPLVVTVATVLSCWAGTGGVLAQDDGAAALRVLVPIAPGVDPAGVSVSDCTFAGTDLSGTGLIFECAPVGLHALTVGDETRHGHVQLRRGLRIEGFSPHPVYELVADALNAGDAAEALRALDPALRPLGSAEPQPEADVAATPDAAPSAPRDGSRIVTLAWPQDHGTLRLADGQMIEIVGQEEGSFLGRVAADGTEDTLVVVSSINEACRVSVPVADGDAPVPVALPCTVHEVDPTLAGDFSGAGCFSAAGRAMTCLLPEGQEIVSLSAPGWRPLEVAPGAPVTLEGLSPDIEVPAAGDEGESCAPTRLEIALSGYCDGESCAAPASGPVVLEPGMAIPGPVIAGHAGTALPDGIALRVTPEGGAPVERVFALEAGVGVAVADWLETQMAPRVHPLDLTLDSTQYRLGRQVRFYSDASCAAPLEGRFVDLSNPGNRRPDLPQCSWFRVEDAGRVRSDCLPVSYAAQTQRVSATLPPEACPEARVVVMVTEDSRLNGAAGRAITAALDGVMRRSRDSADCVALDVAHSVGEDREVLHAAEDLHFASVTGAGDAPLRLDFVTPAADVLRDLEWVYRIWGRNLAGIVLVADGTDVKPANMIESPAAMAWKLNNVMTQVITFDASRNCTDFEQTLLFESCVAGEADQFDAQLTQAVDRALDTIRGQQ